jgi:phosphoserine phosphatase
MMQRLAKMLVEDQLVLFVGSGISRQAKAIDGDPAHLPLWDELAKRVAQCLSDKLENYNNRVLDLFDAAEANAGRGELEDAVRRSIPHERFRPSSVHAEIAKLRWHVVVTTNYDDLLDRCLSEISPISEEAQFDWLSRDSERRPRLVHIHGTLERPHTLTGQDYVSWAEKHPRAYSFLENMALNKTILFVGYSFSDPHLMQGLLPWVKRAMAGRGKRHFAWMWNVTPEQIKLLDKRDMIEVMSIEDDAGWTSAFSQLAEESKKEHGAVGDKVRKKESIKIRQSKHLNGVDDETAIVNGYKLFFYRSQRQLSVRGLARETGIDATVINNLEQVRKTALTGPNCFKRISRSELSRIERVLTCVGKLEFGNDDFIAKFVMFYMVNKPKKQSLDGGKTLLMDFRPDTKAVVFDFGGTLSHVASSLSTWERMWVSVGYSTADAGHYLRLFVDKKISHQDWCDVTARRLAERGFSEAHFQAIINEIRPVKGVSEAIGALRAQNTLIYIVSGSVKQIIISVLGEHIFSMFEEVKANEMIFGRDSIISTIRGHSYDFEGKAEFVRRVIREQKCNPLDVLFVGNSLNDSWASESGARTLCVNPADVDFTDTRIWTDHIRVMDDLREILRFARRS